MKIFALLTGKGGSSLKNKNLLKIFDKKILDYPCLIAKKVKSIDDFYVSSEDEKILSAAHKNGFKKIKRPKNLSLKTSKHIDVLKHSLNFFQNKKITPEIIVVLLANSPTIKKEWIEKSINILKKNKKITSVVPVQKNNDFHPLRAKKITKKYLNPYIKYSNKISSNRQDLPSNYFLTHNFWTIRTSSIIKNDGYAPWKFMGKKCYPLIINNSIDIHEKIDLVLAKYLIKNYY
tara:strand:- start:771 stop:1469 length:699 start_codon:yes stop_codon:yes gene_type:complete